MTTVRPPLAFVRLDDARNRNRLTEPARVGLIAALRAAAADQEVRAIVLCGRDDVFCAGAPPERMLAGHQERVVDMWELSSAVLDCPIPVVAAARGHAMGGGLLLALCADVVVLGEHSRYSAAFARFGFTPSLGASEILPTVLGRVLGAEMLYTGRGYAGRELAARGAGVEVVPADRVEPVALRAARLIAGSSRRTVELLKARLAAPFRAAVRSAHELEIPDHELTIDDEAVRARIRALAASDRGAAHEH